MKITASHIEDILELAGVGESRTARLKDVAQKCGMTEGALWKWLAYARKHGNLPPRAGWENVAPLLALAVAHDIITFDESKRGVML